MDQDIIQADRQQYTHDDEDAVGMISDLFSGSISRRQFVKRASALGASVSIAGSALAALENSAAAAPVRGGTLTMARNADADNLDPYNTVEDPGIFIDLQIFDRLVKVSTDGKSIQPELASHWTFSNGGRTTTFKLRTGIKFSDGTLLTADDVVFSLNRAFDPKSNWSFLFGPVESNWPKPGGSAKKVDNSTVAITLSKPFAPLLSALSTFAASIYPAANYAKWGNAGMGKHPVGTGAFMLESWNVGTSLTLVKNPHYRVAGRPYLDKLVFHVVNDDSARVLQLEGGTVDLIDNVAAPQISTLKASGHRIYQVPGGQLMFVRFNYRHAPYTDINVRRALAWAADRKKMVTDIYHGYGKPAASLILPSSFYYDGSPSTDPPGFNLAKAKNYLSRSSRPRGFSDTLLYRGGDSAYNSAMQIWAADLKKIGINLTLRPTDPAQLGSTIYGPNWHMGGLYFTPDTPDPDEILGLVDYAIANAIHTYFHDGKLHNELVHAREDLNPTRRRSEYAAIQKRINDLAATINFVTQPRLYAGSAKVQGFKPNSQGRYYFENVWLTS